MSYAAITDYDSAVRGEFTKLGIEPPVESFIFDGVLRRLHMPGDRSGTKNGAYKGHSDFPVSFWFQDFKRGLTFTWCEVEQGQLSSFERSQLRQRAERDRAERLIQLNQQHVEIASKARYLWRKATAADPDHPYLVRKQVAPRSARQMGENLVLPVMDLTAAIWSLQFIAPQIPAEGSDKRLLAGGKKKGNVIPVAGRMPGASRILICEGWATGSTLADMEPDALVLAAIDSGNLEPVAVAVRRRWPEMEIVICCDTDDSGREKGRLAALAARASIAIPEFPDGINGSDFNDLANAMRQGMR